LVAQNNPATLSGIQRRPVLLFAHVLLFPDEGGGQERDQRDTYQAGAERAV
jgi:hypothetical protein